MSKLVNEDALFLGRAYLLLLPLIIAFLLRVAPSLLSGLPFSVDSWPPIKYAETLLENTPISLSSEILGYREGSAGEQLGNRFFGALISVLTGLQPVNTMAFYLPLAGGMSVLILYAFVRGKYGVGVAFAASMFLAAAFPDVILTAGVKGETYAHPLYMALILIFLHRGMLFWERFLLFSLVGLSLAITHYYTAILTVAVLASIGSATLILRWRAGKDLEIRIMIYPLILGLTVLFYLMVYARWGFQFISSIDWLSAASYQLIFFTVALYLMLKSGGKSPVRSIFFSSIVTFISFLVVFIATRKSLTPGSPILPIHYLLYVAPFLMAIPPAALGYGWSKSLGDEYVVPPLFWLSVILGLECYAIFGSLEAGLGHTLLYRGSVFLLPPFFMLSAMGLVSPPGIVRGKTRGVAKVLAAVISATILALNVYAFHATIFMHERYLGYFWLYRIPEYKIGAWLLKLGGNRSITGDVKYAYMLKGYFGLNYDEFKGFLYLSGKASLGSSILVTYDWMGSHGYVVYGGYSVDLPRDWMKRADGLSLIYSNGIVNLHIDSV